MPVIVVAAEPADSEIASFATLRRSWAAFAAMNLCTALTHFCWSNGKSKCEFVAWISLNSLNPFSWGSGQLWRARTPINRNFQKSRGAFNKPIWLPFLVNWWCRSIRKTTSGNGVFPIRIVVTKTTYSQKLIVLPLMAGALLDELPSGND